jgi:cytochrome P450
LEAKIAISTLIKRIPGLALGVPRKQLEWRSSFLMRGLKTFPVVY